MLALEGKRVSIFESGPEAIGRPNLHICSRSGPEGRTKDAAVTGAASVPETADGTHD